MARITFEKVVNMQNIKNAWMIVKSKGSAGGVDEVSLAEYEKSLHKNFNKLLQDLKHMKWKPQPQLNGLLDEDTKKMLASHILVRLNKYEKYRGEERNMLDIIDFQVKEIVDAMTDRSIYKPYLAKW